MALLYKLSQPNTSEDNDGIPRLSYDSKADSLLPDNKPSSPDRKLVSEWESEFDETDSPNSIQSEEDFSLEGHSIPDIFADSYWDYDSDSPEEGTDSDKDYDDGGNDNYDDVDIEDQEEDISINSLGYDGLPISDSSYSDVESTSTVSYECRSVVTNCAISMKNIVAIHLFKDGQNKVYVSDLIRPWHRYEIGSLNTESKICAIEWSNNGEQLLLAYEHGLAEIWVMRHNSLNSWYLQYKAIMRNEYILGAKFFNMGGGYYFSSQKRDAVNYLDKFEKVHERPTVTNFSSGASDGCILVSREGKIGVIMIPPFAQSSEASVTTSAPTTTTTSAVAASAGNTIELQPNTTFLSHSPRSARLCSISYCRSGCLNVAISNHESTLIYCYKVSVSLPLKQQLRNQYLHNQISTQQHYQMMSTLRVQQDISNSLLSNNRNLLDLKTTELMHVILMYENKSLGDNEECTYSLKAIRWITVNGCDEIMFVAYECIETDHSFVEQWNLTKKQQQMSAKLLQQGPNKPNMKNEYAVPCLPRWEIVAKVQFNVPLLDICLSKLPTEMTYVYVTLSDNTVQMFEIGLKKFTSVAFEKMQQPTPMNGNIKTITCSGVSGVAAGGMMMNMPAVQMLGVTGNGINMNSLALATSTGSVAGLNTNIACLPANASNNSAPETEMHPLLHTSSAHLKTDVTFFNQLLLVCDIYEQIYAIQIPQNNSNTNNHNANMNLNLYDKNYKMNPTGGPNNALLNLAVALLEYAIISGVDTMDILLTNMHQLDVLAERLTENFMRQAPFVRQYYYTNFLTVKGNICRVIHPKNEDFDSLIILHALSVTFKSFLRPADLSVQDKGPAENLSLILSEPMTTDIDKILCVLDAKDFTVEPFTLQSIQQLVQWISDLALNILARLPEDVYKKKFNKKQQLQQLQMQQQQQQQQQQQYLPHHGYDISRDVVAIGTIRELLVMIRIWGLLNPACLPIYTKSLDQMDVVPVLFRLLTRLIQNPNDPDDNLLDDCNMLGTQIYIPIKTVQRPMTILNHYLSNKTYPLMYRVGEEPHHHDNYYGSALVKGSTRDDVSVIYMGTNPKLIRRCHRCGFSNNIYKLPKTAAMKTWYQKWHLCHCGGLWLFHHRVAQGEAMEAAIESS